MTRSIGQKRLRQTSNPSLAAFLLCGGLGTRLRGLTDRPKAVLDVAGWPFLRYHLELLAMLPIDRIIFLTGYGAEEVERTFGPPSDQRIFIAEEAPRGTAGALAAAREWAGEVNWIANGDSYIDLSPRSFLDSHRPGTARIATVGIEDRTDYGGLEIDEEERIVGFIEKGVAEAGWINAGLYLLDHAFFEQLAEGGSSLERDHFPRWAAEGRLFAYRSTASFRDIGTPERFELAQREFEPIRRRFKRASRDGAH